MANWPRIWQVARFAFGTCIHPVSFELAGQCEGQVSAGLAANLRSEENDRCRVEYRRSEDDPRIVWYPG